MKMELSPRQLEFYGFIVEYINKNGHSPSLMEIAASLKLKSQNSVAVMVDRLINKGYLMRKRGTVRSLVLVDEILHVHKVTREQIRIAIDSVDGRISKSDALRFLNKLDIQLKD